MNIASILAIVSYIPSIISTVRSLTSWAESLFNQPKSGPYKKKFVLDGLQDWAKWMAFFSTGGQKETWQMIYDNFESFSDALGSIVDWAVSIFINGNES